MWKKQKGRTEPAGKGVDWAGKVNNMRRGKKPRRGGSKTYGKNAAKVTCPDPGGKRSGKKNRTSHGKEGEKKTTWIQGGTSTSN